MASFTDNFYTVRTETVDGEEREIRTPAPRRWTIDIDKWIVQEVKRELGVDLFGLFDSHEAATLLSDPSVLVDVIYVLCREQCEKRGVSDREFGRFLVGDALERATDALLDGVSDFSQARKRATQKLMIAKSKMVVDEIQARQLKALREVDLDSLIGATASPANSASTSAAPTGAV